MDTMSAFAMGQASKGRPAKVFDWDFEKWEGPIRYDMVKTGNDGGGGMMQKTDEMPHACLNV